MYKYIGRHGLGWVVRGVCCLLGKTSQQSAVTGVTSPPECLSVNPPPQPRQPRPFRGGKTPRAKTLQPRARNLAEAGRHGARPCNGKGRAASLANSVTGFACGRAGAVTEPVPGERELTAAAPASGEAAFGRFSPKAEARDGAAQGATSELCDQPCPSRRSPCGRQAGFARLLVNVCG